MSTATVTFRWPFETPGAAIARDEVGRAWAAYRDERADGARSLIVERYLHLVRYMARTLSRSLPPTVDGDDLVSAGTEGLLGAVERFDPAQGVDFAVYALTRIRGAMTDFVRSLDPLGRSTRRRIREARRAQSSLEQELCRPPSDHEAAARLGIGVDAYRSLMAAQSGAAPLSLDKLDGDDEGHARPLWTRLADASAPCPLGRVLDDERARDVAALIAGLPAAQRLVLHLYYVEELNFRETAMILDVSESRATQLHSAAIRALREARGARPAGAAMGLTPAAARRP